MTWDTRPGEQSDEGFVIKTWTNHLRQQLPRPVIVRENEVESRFWFYWKDLLSRLLKRIQVVVASDPTDVPTIWGFAAIDYGIPRFVYVREAWRNRGIGTSLMSPVSVGRHRFEKWNTSLHWLARESHPGEEIMRIAREANKKAGTGGSSSDE